PRRRRDAEPYTAQPAERDPRRGPRLRGIPPRGDAMTRPLRLTPDPSWAFFLDLDGTLLPFASSPRRTRSDTALRHLIGDLHNRTGGAVAIITGRPIETVERLFHGLPLAIAGLHGLECRTSGGRLIRHARPSPRLREIRAE